MKKVIAGLALAAAIVSGSARVAWADANDPWLTAKTKIALMTTDNLRTSELNVDTVNGVVTLHGKVTTENQKQLAEQVAKGTSGVKSVKNLLQVVPQAKESLVEAKDDVIKDDIARKFKASARLSKSGIHVASVNKGVVLLAGSSDDIATHLAAIEVAYTTKGVHKVASEVKVKEVAPTH